jgi:predicted RNase H-like HicB family nuclease
MRSFVAYIEFDPESNLYVGMVPGIPGAHTQGATLDELNMNLQEVLALCLEEYEGIVEDLPRFVGVQQPGSKRPLLQSLHRVMCKIWLLFNLAQ